MKPVWSARGLVVILVGALVSTLVYQPAGAAVDLPDGFSVATVAGGFDSPTSVAFAPDGSIYVTEKRGRLLSLDGPGDDTPTLVLNLQSRVHNNSDRGLTGLAADPLDPNLVYVGYTLDRLPGGGPIPAYGTAVSDYDPCPNSATTGCPALSRVARINATTGVETVLFEGHCQQFPFHTIGDLLFDAAGRLVVTFGDGSTGSFVEYGQRGNLCGDPGGPIGTDLTAPTTEGGQARSQDVLTRDDPTGVHGSVLRVNRQTFEASGDNPLFGDGEPNVARMVATGFRNPFRATIDPATGRYYVGNVGGAGREEIQSLSPETFTNGGWPCYEGTGTTQNTFWLTTDICSRLIASGDHDPPLFAYQRNTAIVPGENCSNGGLSISGLAVNRSGFGTPAMNGGLFFTDYTRSCIWYLPSDGQGGITADPRLFATGVGGLVDLTFGPDGALYAIDILGDRLLRFSSGTGPQPPVAALVVVPIAGAEPRTVSLDASDSFDPNPGDALTYAWDVDGDGITDLTGRTGIHTYDSDGTYTVRLTVTDDTGRSSTASTVVIFGGEPIAQITEPSDGRIFRVGAVVPVKSTVTGADGQSLPSSAASWELILHHCIPLAGCHTHGLEGIEGANGVFVMPDHEYPSNVELVLTVNDPNGGTIMERTEANYRTVDVDVTSQPSGVPVLVGSTEEATPFTRQVAAGATTSVAVADPLVYGGQSLGFLHWRLAGAVAGTSPGIEFAPAINTTLRAEFDSGGLDDERPSTPRGLRLTPGADDIRLSWTSSTDNVAVAGYRVYRSTDGTLGQPFAETGPGSTWTDNSVDPATTYTYAVRARDAAGNLSWRSNLASAGVTVGADTQRPSTPTGLRAIGGPSGIEMTWNPSTDDVGVVGYIIHRSTDGSFGPPWQTVPGDVVGYTDADATAGITYTFGVKAIDAAGNTSWRTNLSSTSRGG